MAIKINAFQTNYSLNGFKLQKPSLRSQDIKNDLHIGTQRRRKFFQLKTREKLDILQ